MTYQYAIDYAPWEFNLLISYNHSKKKVTIIKPRGNITSSELSSIPNVFLYRTCKMYILTRSYYITM
jgi:hypothetical protein